jgi:hypothetical protein
VTSIGGAGHGKAYDFLPATTEIYCLVNFAQQVIRRNLFLDAYKFNGNLTRVFVDNHGGFILQKKSSLEARTFFAF